MSDTDEMAGADDAARADGDAGPTPTEPSSDDRAHGNAIADPAELLRIAAMLNRLNSELQEIDLDQQSVERIGDLHREVLGALAGNLDEELIDELHRLVPALRSGGASEADVRVAHLLLVGWLEGLFQGIQASALGNQLRRHQLQEAGGDRQLRSAYL